MFYRKIQNIQKYIKFLVSSPKALDFCHNFPQTWHVLHVVLKSPHIIAQYTGTTYVTCINVYIENKQMQPYPQYLAFSTITCFLTLETKLYHTPVI